MSICLSIINITETVSWIFMKFSINICAAKMSFLKIGAVKGICYLQAEVKILLIFSIFFVLIWKTFRIENICRAFVEQL
jgi:hypothetical protein